MATATPGMAMSKKEARAAKKAEKPKKEKKVVEKKAVEKKPVKDSVKEVVETVEDGTLLSRGGLRVRVC
jgi:hypothetical protein